MQSYKQLQLFDTLALYFNRIHEGAREESVFPHIPMTAAEDVDVTVTPMDGGTYRVTPWPFAGDDLTVTFEGRYMLPDPDGAIDGSSLPVETQTVTLIAG